MGKEPLSQQHRAVRRRPPDWSSRARLHLLHLIACSDERSAHISIGSLRLVVAPYPAPHGCHTALWDALVLVGAYIEGGISCWQRDESTMTGFIAYFSQSHCRAKALVTASGQEPSLNPSKSSSSALELCQGSRRRLIRPKQLTATAL